MKTTSALPFLSLAVVVAPLLAMPVWAAPHDTETIFNASDASEKDFLGAAVAISGGIAIVSAELNDYAGTNSGSAYLFDVTTGNELFHLTASDAAANDNFSHSVVIDGNKAIVYASDFFDDDAGPRSGSVYVFDVTTGNEVMKLTASDAATKDYFGHGLAISGNRIIVGAYQDDDAGISSGSAYLFDATTGAELMKLTASDAAAGDWFGYWVTISGNIAVVGARRADNAVGGANSGSVYVFDVTTGNELFKLTASDATAGYEFGYAVAIDGNTLIVGTWGFLGTGAAYLFDVTTGEELMKLTASDGEVGDRFGYSVGIDGNTVIVGAYGDDDAGSSSGSAYLFDLTFGDELLKLTASDAAAGDEFGTAVGISGDMVLVGALRHDNTDGIDVGQAYAFDISTALPPGADFNDDGTVDNADLLIWESSYANQRLDFNGDGQVDGTDFLLWQQSYIAEIVFDESSANLDQQGPVDSSDLLIWEQSYGVNEIGDIDNDGDTDGFDFLELQRELTPYDAADVNRDRLVDGHDLEFWEASFGWVADADGDGDIDGDANGDGIVTELDYLWWQKQANSDPALSADFDESGLVDGVDLGIWEDSFAVNNAGDAEHDGGPPPVSAASDVPEPTTCGLALAALCLAMSRCRSF